MEDNAIVNRISTAMQSRLAHFELKVDHVPWLVWAGENKIDYRIMSYITKIPDSLYNFDPDHNDKTFAAPRTWHFLSKLIQNIKTDLFDKLPLLSSVIGEAMAREFAVYTAVYTNLPKIEDIKAVPLQTMVPTDPGMLHALIHLIAANMTVATVPQLMKYIERLPIEFITLTLQNSIRRNKALVKEDAIKKWVDVHSPELF